jgi:serine/threonine-protein kinase
VLLGTTSYISPEQIRGESATPASDWYAFGCVLYQLLTGTPPFTGPTVESVMRQHLDAAPQPINRADVSPELAGLVLKLLAKDPQDRPSSAAAVIAQLTAPTVDNSTQVLPYLPTAAEDGPARSGRDGAARAEVLGVGRWEEEPEEPAGAGAHRAPRKGFPFAKVIVAMAVVLAAVVGGLLLRESVATDPPAAAGGTPSAPATKATVAPKAEATPSPTPSKTPSKTPSAKPTQTQGPQTVSAQTLRVLAQAVRQSAEGGRSKAPREAARDLDQAANALAEGDEESASKHFYDARKRLVEAQRDGRWQATPQIAALFSAISQALPPTGGDGDGDSDE